MEEDKRRESKDRSKEVVYLPFFVILFCYSNVGRLFCTLAPPKFTKKLAVDSFFNFGS